MADTSFSGWAIDNSVSSLVDADGVSNLLEFVLGLDPGREDGSRIEAALFAAAPQLELRFNKQASALDDSVVYSVSVAETLGAWNSVGAVGTDSSLLVDTSEQIHARAFGATNAFMRLVVLAPTSASLASFSVQAARKEIRLAANHSDSGRNRYDISEFEFKKCPFPKWSSICLSRAVSSRSISASVICNCPIVALSFKNPRQRSFIFSW